MFFSIIVPTYNRERFIKRCLMSVLAQDFKDFEIIVVDDGSTDGTAASVRAFTDSRLRLIVQEKNRGKGPACNTGNAAARGDWIVSLDSDDELLPGALTCMYKHAIAGSEAIDAHWFRCRMDDGRICPDPLPSRLEWDYDGFLAFREETRGRWPDMVRCVRRIAAGETWIDNQSVNWVIEAYRSQAAALVSPRTQPRLSPKEMAIITCITQGKRNKEIAFQLGTTEQVIKNYLRKIYDKLGVSDRLELALYCLHNKIIQTDADEETVAQKVLGQ